MAGDNFDLDDIDIDNFDFGDDNSNPSAPNGRSPVTRVASSFASAAKETATSPSFFARTLKKALPEGYRAAIDAVDDAGSAVGDLYNEADKDLSPAKKMARNQLKKALPFAEKMLPASLAKKLRDMTEEAPGTRAKTVDEIRDESIALRMSETFDGYRQEMEVNQDIQQKNERNRLKLDKAKHNDQMTAMVAVKNSLSRIVSFQDKVTYSYNKKMLELGYRQLYTQRDILEHTRANGKFQKEVLEAIRHNTSLPDAIKLKGSEAFRAQLRSRAINAMQSKAIGSFSGLFQNVKENSSRMLKGFAGSANAAADQAEMMKDMEEMGLSKSDLAMSAGVGMGADELGGRAARKLNEWAEQSAIVRAINHRLLGAINSAPNAIQDWADTPDEIDPTDKAWQKGKKVAGNFLKTLIANPNKIDQISVANDAKTMSEKVDFDYYTQRTINEVIPGYLSRILRETIVARTGDESVGTEHYDFVKGTFITSKQQSVSTRQAVLSNSTIDSVQGNLDAIINIIDPDDELSGSQRRTLERTLINRARRGRLAFQDGQVGKSSFYDGSAEDNEALAAHMSNILGLDKNRKERILGERYSRRSSDLSKAVNSFGSHMPSIAEEVAFQIRQGNTEVLVKEGILRIDGDQFSIDEDKVAELLMKRRRMSGGGPRSGGGGSGGGGPRKFNPYSPMWGDSGFRATFIKENKLPTSYRQYGMQDIDMHDGMIAGLLSRGRKAKGKLSSIAGSASQKIQNTVQYKQAEKAVDTIAKKVANGDVVNVESVIATVKDPEARKAVVETIYSTATDPEVRQQVIESAEKLIKDPHARQEVLIRAQKRAGGAATVIADKITESLTARTGHGAAMDRILGNDVRRNSQYQAMRGYYAAQEAKQGLAGAGKDAAMRSIGIGENIAGTVRRHTSPEARKQVREQFTALGSRITKQLNHAKLAAGEYIDGATGQTVTRLEDIKGEVRDRKNRLIMSFKDSTILQDAISRVGGVTATARGIIGRRGPQGAGGSQFVGPMPYNPEPEMAERENNVIVIRDAVMDIRELLASGVGIDVSGDSKAKGKGFGGRILGGLGSGLGSALSGVGKFYGGTFGGIGSILGGAGGMVGGAMKGVGKRLGGMGARAGLVVSDIYTKGVPEPVITAKGLRRGWYTDYESGEPIHSLDDIKGAVYDNNANEMALTADQFTNGIFYYKGESLVKKAGSKLIDFYGAMFSPLTMAARIATMAMRGAVGFATRVKDVYVVGEATPRLLAKVMTNGGYFSQRTQKPIRKYADIDGPVIDGSGETVLDWSDIKKGLVDSSGKPIRSLTERLWNLAKKPFELGIGMVVGSYKLAGKAAAGAGKLLMGGLRGLGGGKKIESEVEIHAASHDILTQIRDLLDLRLPGKGTPWDKDGDGDRDGGWKDRLANRSKRKSGGRDSRLDKAAGAGAGFGLWDRLKGMIPGFGDDGDDSGFDVDVDPTDFFDGDGEGRDKKRRRKQAKKRLKRMRKGGKRGLFRRALDGAKGLKNKVFKAGGKTAARSAASAGVRAAAGNAVKKTALRAGAGVGLRMAATGAAAAGLTALGGVAAGVGAVLASPVVVVGGAIAGIAYLGYSIWDALRDKHLLRMRMAMYGVDPDNEDNEDFLDMIAYLEDELIDGVQIAPDGTAIINPPSDLEDILDEFDIDEDEPAQVDAFMAWMDQRFKPVFATWVAANKAIAPDVDFDDLDGDLEDKQKVMMAKRVCPANSSSHAYYQITISPFPEKGQLDATFATVVRLKDEIIAEFGAKDGSDKAEKAAVTGETVTNSAAAAAVAGAAKSGPNTSKAINATGAMRRAVTGGRVSSIGTGIAIAGAVPKGADRRNLGALDVIRFKTYGLRELDIPKVRNLQLLEAYVEQYLKFGADGAARYLDTAEGAAVAMAESFGVSMGDEEAAMSWIVWFNMRFLPTFLNYATAVNKIDSNLSLEEADRFLDDAQRLEVATNIFTARASMSGTDVSVWSIQRTPWPGYPLNADAGSIRANVASIQNKVRVSTHGEPTGKVLDGAPTTYAAGMSGNTRAANDNPYGISGNTKHNPFVNTMKQVARDKYKDQQSGSVPGSTSGQYIMPAQGRISSEFGPRIHPITGEKGKMHKGIDIAAPEGTPVVATADGVITRREFSQSYGNVVYIKHADGKTSRYAHMHGFAPGQKVGDTVKQGTLIGFVGNTGKSAGNHLHFEIRKTAAWDSDVIDPIKAITGPDAKQMLDNLKVEKQAAKNEGKEDSYGDLEGADTIASQTTGKSEEDKQEAVAGNPVKSVSGIPTTVGPGSATTGKSTTTQVEAQKAAMAKANQMAMSDMAKVLKESLGVQRSMDGHLANISKDIRDMREASLAANDAARKARQQTRTAAPTNPVSVSKSR